MAEKEKSLALYESAAKWISENRAQIALALPKWITADRMIRVILTELRKTPRLLDCRRESLISCIMQAAQLGLEPGGVLGHIFFVPYKDEATPIIGYKGLIDLCRRSGEIVSIAARVVYSRDQFTYQYGLEEKLEHVPALTERGEPLHIYAVAQLVGGGHAFEVMSVADVNAIRDKSKSYGQGDFSPWRTHWSEMARKTAIRRLFKYLPSSVMPREAHELLAAEDTREFPAVQMPRITLPAEDTFTPSTLPLEAPPETKPESTAPSGKGKKKIPADKREAIEQILREKHGCDTPEAQAAKLKSMGIDDLDALSAGEAMMLIDNLGRK